MLVGSEARIEVVGAEQLDLLCSAVALILLMFVGRKRRKTCSRF